MKEVFMRHDKTNVLDTKHAVVKHTFVYAKCLIKFVYDIEISHEAFPFFFSFFFKFAAFYSQGNKDDHVRRFQAAVCAEHL